MRLLFDQNLSHRLLNEPEDIFRGSEHVRFLGLAEEDDLEIWNYAITHELTIVTQNSDYSDWNKLRGIPPKIVWLRCGNASSSEIAQKLCEAADHIPALESSRELEIIEVW